MISLCPPISGIAHLRDATDITILCDYAAWIEEMTAPQTNSAFSSDRGVQVTSSA